MTAERIPLPAPGMGPQSAVTSQDPVRHLSAPRRGVLDALSSHAGPATVAELASLTGQHANTVREHLDALVRVGLALKEASRARGRGRPAVLYSARRRGRRPGHAYDAMVQAFAAEITETTEDPVAWGTAAGRRMTQTALATHPEMQVPGGDPAAVESLVRDLLRIDGFDPQEQADGEVHLRACPMLDAARRFPSVVCATHRGELEGLFLAHRASADKLPSLSPFGIPGACVLRFAP